MIHQVLFEVGRSPPPSQSSLRVAWGVIILVTLAGTLGFCTSCEVTIRTIGAWEDSGRD